jgi:hypothetical protein
MELERHDSCSRRRADVAHGLRLILAACLLHCSLDCVAIAEEADVARQALEDAWWTGPILAPSAATLPQGHFLVEPYLYDSISYARYDADGDSNNTTDTHFLGSQTYVLYGLRDSVSVGIIPRFGFRDVANGRDSSGIRIGDTSLQAQYRMSQFDGVMPTTSVVLQLTLPTGKHDELGDRPTDGMGSGAYSAMLGVYSQYFFWMPNGRLLRTRLNVSQTFFDNADVSDVSVYGTEQGFRGRAKPGDSFVATLAGEYSITRAWVLALDLQYQRDAGTRLIGNTADANRAFSTREAISIAPAVEYNFNGSIGLIVGGIWTIAGRNTELTVTPVVALNMVY